MQKWDFKEHKYEPYFIPPSWDCPLICDDMDKVVNCASCGEQKTFGELFTSLKIHTPIGIGFFVCEDCYTQEHKERSENI